MIFLTRLIRLAAANPRKIEIFNRLNNKNEFRSFCKEKGLPPQNYLVAEMR